MVSLASLFLSVGSLASLALASGSGSADKLQIGILKKGVDCSVKAHSGDTVAVHYSGRLQATGSEFDSSYTRGQPISFVLGAGQVIEGWDKGVLGMCLGEKRRLSIPPHLGYGSKGAGPIPPESTLVFDTELVGVNGETIESSTESGDEKIPKQKKVEKDL